MVLYPEAVFLPLRSYFALIYYTSRGRVGGARRSERVGVQITFCTWLTASFISHEFIERANKGQEHTHKFSTNSR